LESRFPKLCLARYAGCALCEYNLLTTEKRHQNEVMHSQPEKPSLSDRYLYSDTVREWRSASERTQAVLAKFGAQLGEIAFHSIVLDERIDKMSKDDGAAILEVAQLLKPVSRPIRILARLLKPVSRPIRILEIGVHAHYSVHMAASSLGGVAVSHDISPNALRIGSDLSHQKGYRSENFSVAGDFHDLPFHDNAFDIVFCNSCIHHTWRPWKVIQELIRVCRPGGLIRLQNEPVIRVACFYQFRGRRPETLQGIEAAIESRHLTMTISSPYPGARAEKLFGMIENDRIPLAMYRQSFETKSKLLEFEADPKFNTGEFEKWLLSLDRSDANLEEIISVRLHEEIACLSQHFAVRDALSGLTLPSSDSIWLLSYRIAEHLRKLDRTSNPKEILAELFGASLKVTARKFGEAEVSKEIFRRRLIEDRGVLIDSPKFDGIKVDFQNKIPALEQNSHALANVFPLSSWFVLRKRMDRCPLLIMPTEVRYICPKPVMVACYCSEFIAFRRTCRIRF
jgi:ubiquinone/menaquinone biosynthesis C-methylase UbiE